MLTYSMREESARKFQSHMIKLDDHCHFRLRQDLALSFAPAP